MNVPKFVAEILGQLPEGDLGDEWTVKIDSSIERYGTVINVRLDKRTKTVYLITS